MQAVEVLRDDAAQPALGLEAGEEFVRESRLDAGQHALALAVKTIVIRRIAFEVVDVEEFVGFHVGPPVNALRPAEVGDARRGGQPRAADNGRVAGVEDHFGAAACLFL